MAALRDELGHIEIQKLAKAALEGLVGRLRRGEVEGRKKWTPRSCNYLLHLMTAVLDDQVSQGNVVRNVARLVDRAVPTQTRKLATPQPIQRQRPQVAGRGIHGRGCGTSRCRSGCGTSSGHRQLWSSPISRLIEIPDPGRT